LDERCIPEQAARRPRRRLREEIPEDESRKKVNCEMFDRHPEDLREDDREDDHQEERIQHRPQDAEHGALVANLQVSRDEVTQEAAIADDLAQRSKHGMRVANGMGRGKRRGARSGLTPTACPPARLSAPISALTRSASLFSSTGRAA